MREWCRGDGQPEVRWYGQQGRAAEGRNAFGHTAEILRFLAEFTGVPYPARQYTQIAVPDFIFGGMENFTVTTQTDLTLHDDRAHLDFSSDDLVAHEAAHSWFGNLVTAREWAHAWLHESFATYLEALYARESKGADEFDYQVLRDAEAYFHEAEQYHRPIVTQRYEAPIDLFDAHLYPGGAVRLRHLPSGTLVGVAITASGRIGVALVYAKQLIEKNPKALFRAVLQRRMSFKVAIPESGDYYLVLDNRRGTGPVSVTATVQAVRGKSAPSPAPAVPKGGGKLDQTRAAGAAPA